LHQRATEDKRNGYNFYFFYLTLAYVKKKQYLCSENVIFQIKLHTENVILRVKITRKM